MSPTAQPRALRFLIALVCALAAILMGVTSASAAAVTTSATVDICDYDVHHQFASMTDTVTERGPPGYDPSGTTDDAVDHGPHGTSARSATAASSAITTYDRTATLVQIARTTGTTDRIAQATDGNFVVFEPSSVAAKTAPEVAEGGGRLFVTSGRGVTYDIPKGWSQRMADNGKGLVFQRGGATGNADMIRIMEPTAKYPSGYARVYNSHGQPVDVFGKPGPASSTHISQDYVGQWPGWPQ